MVVFYRVVAIVKIRISEVDITIKSEVDRMGNPVDIQEIVQNVLYHR